MEYANTHWEYTEINNFITENDSFEKLLVKSFKYKGNSTYIYYLIFSKWILSIKDKEMQRYINGFRPLGIFISIYPRNFSSMQLILRSELDL